MQTGSGKIHSVFSSAAPTRRASRHGQRKRRDDRKAAGALQPEIWPASTNQHNRPWMIRR
jgi:hypothetical protein